MLSLINSGVSVMTFEPGYHYNLGALGVKLLLSCRSRGLWYNGYQLLFLLHQHGIQYCKGAKVWALTKWVKQVFIIHPCDPIVVICYLIWPCDTTVCITYLVSHSYSLTYNLRIFQFGCIINTKLPSGGFVYILHLM